MGWKFTDETPIYLQIVEMIKTEIVSGKYHSGDKLPAVRDLALEAGVNPNTVQKAFSELERQGLVRSERTSGRFVEIDVKEIEILRNSLSDSYIKELFMHLKQLGMDEKSIKEAVSNWEDKG